MNLIALLPHEKQKYRVLKSLKDVYTSEEICYVTINKPRESLLPVLEEWFDLQYIYLIDAVTRTVQDEPEPMPNGAYISSPAAFDELYEHIDKLLSTRQFGALVFDSLCTLTTYKDALEVKRFMHKLLPRVTLAKCEGVFICIRPIVDERFIEVLHMLADKVINFE